MTNENPPIDTEFELNGEHYVVIESDNDKWIYYKYKDGRTPHHSETMGFMPFSNNWRSAKIIE